MNKERKQHILRSTARTELPSSMIFVDTETKGVEIKPGTQKHTLWFGWACYVRVQKVKGVEQISEKWIRFETAGAFWDWVEGSIRARTRTWIFAHNWNFDAAILWVATIPLERGWECQKYINNKPPVIISLRRDPSTLFLIDTLNYFAMPLDKLGENIGIPKIKMPAPDATREEWDTYAHRDVEVIKSGVLQFREFVKQQDLGTFKPTLAGQAFMAYRHKYMTVPIMIHDRARVAELEREGYFGGRVECFHRGKVKGPLYLLDINSLYPAVMASQKYPHVLIKDYRGGTVTDLRTAMKTHGVMATVTLQTERPIFPKFDGLRLLFPTGEFTTTLTTPELRMALGMNEVVAVHHTAEYLMAPLFNAFVTDLYRSRLEFRKQGNDAFDWIAKYIMNGLYGKFGQRLGKWEEVEHIIPPDVLEWTEQDITTDIIYNYRVRMGVVQREMGKGEAYDAFPAIAAHVTAYGRLALWRLVVQAGRDNVFYCDTDSVVVNATGYKALRHEIHQKRLGALKLEGKFATGDFTAPKHYRLGKRIRIKGIRKNARKIGKDLYEQERFVSWDWLHAHGEDGYILIHTIRKQLTGKYTKGTVMPDGRIQPFVLGGASS